MLNVVAPILFMQTDIILCKIGLKLFDQKQSICNFELI